MPKRDKSKKQKLVDSLAETTEELYHEPEPIGAVASDRKLRAKGISRREYERQLAELHIELVKLQHWIIHKKLNPGVGSVGGAEFLHSFFFTVNGPNIFNMHHCKQVALRVSQADRLTGF